MTKYKGDYHVRMTAEEMDIVHHKMETAGITNINYFFRKMALEGYCVVLDLSDIRELITLLRRCSNNLNQYTRRANENGSIYSEDIQDLKLRLDEIWEETRRILGTLAKL